MKRRIKHITQKGKGNILSYLAMIALNALPMKKIKILIFLKKAFLFCTYRESLSRKKVHRTLIEFILNVFKLS